MSEAALWLNYCLSGVIAFLVIYLRRWRIVPAMLMGTATSLAIYLLVSLGRGGAIDDPWIEAALFINGSFALIAASAGAVLAFALRARNDET